MDVVFTGQLLLVGQKVLQTTSTFAGPTENKFIFVKFGALCLYWLIILSSPIDNDY